MKTVADDYFRSTLLRYARQLQADIENEIDSWDDEFGFALSKSVQTLLRTVEANRWHLVEALAREVEARLEAAEEAGKMDEGTVSNYAARLTVMRGYAEEEARRVGQQRRADAVVRELLDG